MVRVSEDVRVSNALHFQTNYDLTNQGNDFSKNPRMLIYPLPTAAPYNGWPMWSNLAAGFTLFRRIQMLPTIGYVGQWWFSDSTTFSPGSDGVHDYLGMCPYPPGSNGGTTYNWEISAEWGDMVTNQAGGTCPVVFDNSWLTQAMRLTYVNANLKNVRFWTNLANISTNTIIDYNCTLPGYLSTPNHPASPQITIGASVWPLSSSSAFANESGAMNLTYHLMIAKAMTDADVAAQGALIRAGSTALLAGDATNFVWNQLGNFVLPANAGVDQSSAGHNFSWFTTSNEATIVAGPVDGQSGATAEQANLTDASTRLITFGKSMAEGINLTNSSTAAQSNVSVTTLEGVSNTDTVAQANTNCL